MIISLFDHTEIYISKDKAEKLTQSLEKSGDGIVKIDDWTIKKSAIAYIKPGGMTQSDVMALEINQEQKALEAGRRVGSSSSISNILKDRK